MGLNSDVSTFNAVDSSDASPSATASTNTASTNTASTNTLSSATIASTATSTPANRVSCISELIGSAFSMMLFISSLVALSNSSTLTISATA